MRSLMVCTGLLVAALALNALPAKAAQVVWRSGPCPLGNDTVRAFSLVSENKVGGWDSDTAGYSANGQWRTHKVATCADNLFSLYGEDMPTFEPDPTQQQKLLAVLEQAKRELSNPEAPEVWERYRIAARMYSEIGRSSWFMANLWLEASWTVRDSGVGYYEGLNGPEVTRTLLDAGDSELAKGLPASQEKSVRFNLARVAFRGGYTARRDAHIAAFKALGPMTPREAEAVGKMERAAKIEPFYQREALRYFELAMADASLRADERATARYLVADLNRRLGKADTARTHFQAALDDPALTEDLAVMARFLMQELSPTP